MDGDRDVILVTVDSLRADRCGFLERGVDLTPTLDRLAEDGLVFDTAVAPSTTTLGSVPAFHTGEFLVDRSFFATPPDKREWVRRHLRARDTLAERFSRRGYETGAFTANPWSSRYYGFDRGFDQFEDFMDEDMAGGLIESGVSRRSATLGAVTRALNWWQGQDMFMSWEAFYDDVVAWIRQAESPYFLWLFLVDVHMPYIPSPEYRSDSKLRTYLANMRLYAGTDPTPGSATYETLVRSYEDTVRYTDAFVDRLSSDLGDDDPLLVFHADHGEELNEHGHFGHRNVREGAIHVPLLVANGPADRVERPFSLLGLPDLVESLATGGGYDDLTTPYALARNYDPQLAVRGGDWKYVRWPDGEDLYAVEGGDERPLDRPDLAATGRDVVDAWLAHDRERARIADAAGIEPPRRRDAEDRPRAPRGRQ